MITKKVKEILYDLPLHELLMLEEGLTNVIHFDLRLGKVNISKIKLRTEVCERIMDENELEIISRRAKTNDQV